MLRNIFTSKFLFLIVFSTLLTLLSSSNGFAQVTKTIYQDQFNGTIDVDVPDAILSQCNNCRYQNFGGTQAGSAYFYINHKDLITGLMFDRSLSSTLINGVNYNFSMYYKNSFSPVPTNYTFTMRNGSAGAVLGSVTRSDFATNTWKEATFSFIGGVSSNVQLSTTSAGSPGGNDNGFDTLVITHLGPTVTISNTAICPSMSTTLSSSLTSSPTHFSSPAYQWQQSTDGGTSWTNISGQTSSSLTLSGLSSSFNSRRYRLLVAQNALAMASSAHQFISNVINLGTIACSGITIRKLSNSGTGTFGFSGGNGFGTDSITTSTAGTAVTGTYKALTTAGTATTITETFPTTGAWQVTNISCSGLGSGGTATPDLPNRRVVLNTAATAAGSNISCTFTNGIPDLTITKSHSGNFTVGSTGNYSFTVTNGGTASTSGVITVTDTLPTGLTIADSTFTPSGTNGSDWSCTAASNVVTCTRAAAGPVIPSTVGSNTSVFNFNVNVGVGTAVGTNSITNTADVSGGGEVVTTNNSSSDPTTVLSPNLTIAKADTADFTVGSTGTYQITVGNSGTAATSGTITVSDTLPTGLSIADGAITEGGANAANWTCNAASNVITCTSTTAIATSGSSVFTFNVNVGTNAPIGTNAISNTATVSGGGEATANNGNNSNTDTTNVLSPNLTIVKSHSGNFTKGSAGTYSISVGNSGTAATSGTITVSDTLPTGLSISDGAITEGGTNSADWTCTAASNVITCTSTTAIATSGSSIFSFNVNVSATAPNSLTNTATVSGGNEATVNNTNNSDDDPTTTVLPPTFGCTDKGYAIKNAGTIAEFWEIDIATGASTQLLNPIIPASLGSQGANSIGYNPLDGLIYGKRIGTNEIVRIASDNSVQIIPITGLPTANLFAADVSSNGIYYLTRTGYTTIERVDLDPSSATYLTRLTPITVSAVNYSDIAINPNDGFGYAITDGVAPHSLLKINLTTGAVTTIGTVTGGGSESVTTTFGGSWMDSSGNLFINHGATGNTYMIAATHTLTTGAVTSVFVSTATTGINDGAKCNTSAVTLSPDLTIVKSHTGNFTKGSTGTYSISVGNSGPAATSGTITVSDTLPTGLNIANGAVTLSGTDSANWSCSAASNVITCTSTTAIATSGSSVFSFTVNVASNAPNSLTNTATVSGGGESTANNGNNSDDDPTDTIFSPPNVGLVKSCPSPSDCTSAPQLPGTDLTYKIEFTNSGGQGAVNMAIVDGIPANTDFKIGSATSNVGTTGLTFVIEFSSDYDPLNPTLATWTYTPVSAGGGASVGYDRNVKAIRWRVTSGTLSNVSPNNIGDVQFVTKIR